LVQERDVSLFVPQVATTAGAFVGNFNWGPAEEFVTIDSEKTLYEQYGKPDDNNFKFWFTAANFLSYGNNLQVNRAVNVASAKNAVAGTTSTGVLIRNLSEYTGDLGYSTPSLAGREYVAKYPGALGNNLKISYVDYESYQFDITVSSVTATSAGVAALARPVPKGSWLQVEISGLVYRFQTTTDAAQSATTLTITNNTNASTAASSVGTVLWEYWDQVESRPTNSRFALSKANASSSATIYDELHVVVADEDGGITGTAGTILEKFQGLSKASDAVSSEGGTAYYKTYINNNSKWVWWGENAPSQVLNTAKVTWGSASPTGATGFTTLAQVVTRSFAAGADALPTDGELQNQYYKLANTEQYDVSLIPVVGQLTDNATARFVVDNVADVRRDCVVFVSPTSSNLITAAQVVADRNVSFNRDTTYAVIDSGWKYQYDRYNDQYRWIPLAGDTAGLCVRTDLIADPWFSPGGYTRGQIKNIVKLNWTPNKTDRDTLYRFQINPIITQPGAGTLLFGDKTATQKPSAFDRINVRRLFIVLEKAIATAAKFQLFEFNDAFTRSQFTALVEPFLRDVQGRRGVTDFLVVCDETNNTAEVIDRNEFVADIYIKPARSINYITLSFVATRSGVEFSEVGA